MRFGLEILRDQLKAHTLTAQKEAELAGMTEPDRIFTVINARIIAES
ncbi:oligoendopeptidase F family protein [Stenomitos frigidus]|nr:oligoendopeptidase F family protein [Stenomitos frigidus]